jgi:hypothetical protein
MIQWACIAGTKGVTLCISFVSIAFFEGNYFTSIKLALALKERSMFYVGTVRRNRLKGVNLKTEKELRKKGRVKSDYQVNENKGIVVVRWFDNKTVDILSNYIGLDPLGEVRRLDKASKSYIQVERPAIIEQYNKFMGAIDLLDSLTSLYKQNIKSRIWYMYIFWHTIMIRAVNSWLWYRRHCKLLQEGKQ